MCLEIVPGMFYFLANTSHTGTPTHKTHLLLFFYFILTIKFIYYSIFSNCYEKCKLILDPLTFSFFPGINSCTGQQNLRENLKHKVFPGACLWSRGKQAWKIFILPSVHEEMLQICAIKLAQRVCGYFSLSFLFDCLFFWSSYSTGSCKDTVDNPVMSFLSFSCRLSQLSHCPLGTTRSK